MSRVCVDDLGIRFGVQGLQITSPMNPTVLEEEQTETCRACEGRRVNTGA